MAELIAACVVHELRPDAGSVGVTAIDKSPVSRPVRMRKLGLHADLQASHKHHGGELQALSVCAQEDADSWENELGCPPDAGWLGENLRVSGFEVPATHRRSSRSSSGLLRGPPDGCSQAESFELAAVSSAKSACDWSAYATDQSTTASSNTAELPRYPEISAAFSLCECARASSVPHATA